MRSWTENIQRIRFLLDHISTKHGGDDPLSLDDYYQELIENNSTNLEGIIAALEDLNTFNPK